MSRIRRRHSRAGLSGRNNRPRHIRHASKLHRNRRLAPGVWHGTRVSAVARAEGSKMRSNSTDTEQWWRNAKQGDLAMGRGGVMKILFFGNGTVLSEPNRAEKWGFPGFIPRGGGMANNCHFLRAVNFVSRVSVISAKAFSLFFSLFFLFFSSFFSAKPRFLAQKTGFCGATPGF